MKKDNLIKEIIDLGIFKVTNTTIKNKWIKLKNGSRAPMFLDTSVFVSYPSLLKKLNKYIIEVIKSKNIKFNKIIGIPYGGLPFSYGVSDLLNCPSLAIRKEGFKNYSTKGELLGKFKKGDIVLIIEDAIVTAKTSIDFIKKLKKKGLIVKDLISIVDVGSKGSNNLKKNNVNLISIFTWKELFNKYKLLNKKSNNKVYDLIDNILINNN